MKPPSSKQIKYYEVLKMSEQKFIKEISSNQVISGIYKIENLINHKVYIGQSKNIYRRWREHVTASKYNNHGYLYYAIRKYGLENFSFEILIETYDRDYWEIFLIQIYHATDNRYGYNVTLGGIGFSFDEETWKKMVINSKIAIANRTEEEKQKIVNKIKTTINNWSDERRAIYWERRKNADKNRSIFNILCINEKLVECDSYWRKLGHRIKFNALEHAFIYNGLEIRKSKNLYFVKLDDLTEENINNFYEHLDDIKNEYFKWWKSTKRQKDKLKVFIKCIETNQIKSTSQWIQLGYQVSNIIHRRLKTSKNKHFVLSNLEEYENYIQENPQEKDIDYSNVEKVEREIIYAKCIETDEIYSVVDWINFGYVSIRYVLNGKNKVCRDEHFVKATKSEYLEYMNNHPNKKEKLELDERKPKQIRYAKCIETNEIHSDKEWWRLGYDGIYNVLNKKSKSTKGKHFIEVDEKEFNDSVNNNEDNEKINYKMNNEMYAKCLETNDILSLGEWKKLGYDIYKLLKGKCKSSKNKHFIKINESEKINYINNITDIEKIKIIERNKIIEKSKYSKCIETNEIKLNTEWINLGYSKLYDVLKGIKKSTKGKHFISVSESDYQNYIKKHNLKLESKNIVYAKCLETNEILSANEWRKLGYCKIYEVLYGKRDKTKNKHFVKVDKSEYEEFILNNKINNNLHDSNLLIKDIIYAKCVETKEIRSVIEWKSLGFERLYFVLNGKDKSCHGKHFIKSPKEEYESYLKQQSAILT